MVDLVTSLQYGIPSAIIVLLYLIITKVADIITERNKEKKRIEVNSEIIDCFNSLNSFLKNITKDIVEKNNDKCSSAIRTSFKSMSYALIRFATFTIINNNVHDNRKNIEDNITTIVDQEYSNVYNALILYYSDNNHIVDYMDENWKKELAMDLRTIIFDTTIDVKTKIYTIHNKLDIRIGKYYTLINNKFFENV